MTPVFQILVKSEHMANYTISAMTCQPTDTICAPSSAEAVENIVCVSQNSRSWGSLMAQPVKDPVL